MDDGTEQGKKSPPRLFVHIPKTAGTSFRVAAESRFGRARVLCDYGLESDATSLSIREEIYQKKHCAGLERAISKNNAVLVAGHIPITKYGDQIGLRNTVTLFRDPVDQVISHYRHVVRDREYQGDLISFARSDRARNMQSRIMANIDPALVGIVGLTEKYRETLAIIKHRWGWDLRHKKKNVSGRLRIRPFDASDEEKAELERLNQSDRVLYTRACQVFSTTLYCLENGTGTDPRGAITHVGTDSTLQGWAFDMLSDMPAKIEILINGVSRSRASCDLFVPDLAKWKIARGGHVGFRAEMDELETGDVVELRDVDSELILASRTFN